MTSFLPDPMHQRVELVIRDIRAGRIVPKCLLSLHLELERALAVAPVVRNEAVGNIRIPVTLQVGALPPIVRNEIHQVTLAG